MGTVIWNIIKNNSFKVRIYEKELKVSRIMASILASLGITLDESRALLRKPYELLNTKNSIYGEEEVERCLLNQDNRIIKIFADYDVDGLMSGYILNDYLSSITGFNSEVYYPSREEGYGLNIDWAKKMIEENDPLKLTVITIDNGITAHEPIKFLRDRGVQVYIIDHHEPIDTNSLPDANAICDAWIDRKYGTHLCAAAVALKIIYRMEKKYPDEVLTTYLPFAALATISDVMPGCPENRAIIQLGLNIINMTYEESPLYALLKSEGLQKLRAKDIAWTIAPMINACSRMNEIEIAKKLFDTSKEYEFEEKLNLARKISNLNRKRKLLTEKAVQEIFKENTFEKDLVVFADGTKYPLGIVGIIAGKLCEATGKPSIVYQIRENIGYGSARAPEGVDIKAIVNYEATCGNAVVALGHAEACGVQIIPSRIKKFNEDLLSSGMVCTSEKTEEEVRIHALITVDDINIKLKKEIDSFGYTSKEIPVLGLSNVKVEPVIWATSSGKTHILFKMKDSKGKDKYAIAWNGYEIYKELGEPERMNLAGELDSGTFCRYCKEVPITEHTTIFTINRMDIAR